MKIIIDLVNSILKKIRLKRILESKHLSDGLKASFLVGIEAEETLSISKLNVNDLIIAKTLDETYFMAIREKDSNPVVMEKASGAGVMAYGINGATSMFGGLLFVNVIKTGMCIEGLVVNPESKKTEIFLTKPVLWMEVSKNSKRAKSMIIEYAKSN